MWEREITTVHTPQLVALEHIYDELPLKDINWQLFFFGVSMHVKRKDYMASFGELSIHPDRSSGKSRMI